MKQPLLMESVAEVLAHGTELLDSVDDVTYSTKAAPPYGASIGEHYRHVLEHFTCVLAGLATGEIDYDRRERDRLLETDLEYAKRMTEVIVSTFRTLHPIVELTKCKVAYSVSYTTSAPAHLDSTFGREVAFAVGHAVHHFAIMKLLCNEMEIGLSPEFGVAPSTIKHRQQALAG